MRTVVIALATVALLAAPAYAQGHGKGARHSASRQQSAEQEQQRKKADDGEKSHSAALHPNPYETFDPWRNMR
ncbi:MAG: hypothetical protein WBW74_03950 [Xanthobacteraceae bacterium]